MCRFFYIFFNIYTLLCVSKKIKYTNMKHIKKFNENLENGQTIFSGQTKNGWKYNIISTDGSRDELQLTAEDGVELDASEILHESVDAYINGDSSTKGFLVDVEDITEAYDKLYELMDRGSSLDGLVTMEDI